MTRFTLGAEEALLEDTDLSLSLGEASLELGFAFLGSLPQGVIEAGLLPSLKELAKVRAIGAAKRRQRTKEVRDGGGKRRGRLSRGSGRKRGGYGFFRRVARAIPRGGRHSRESNAWMSNTIGPRLLRLWVVCGDHPPRRIRIWNKGKSHACTLGHNADNAS
jgi:hypothetical protein